jgi:Thioredoxin
MDGRDYLGPSALRATVLPARAAYLVAEGSQDGLRRAVQEACTRWGGMTEPIIPVKPGGEVDPWWQQVASLARADGAVNVDVSPEDARVAAGELALDVVPLADIDGVGVTAFTVHPLAVGPAMLPGSVFTAASDKHKDITFARVDTEDQPALAGAARITSIPTLMAFRDGILVFSQPGALPAAALDQAI